MSAFDDYMKQGSEALLAQLGDTRAYWPGGDSGSAVNISVAFTPGMKHEEDDGGGAFTVQQGEAMIYADDTLGVATPVILADIIVIGSGQWRVTEIHETVGGMHRLGIELSSRAVRGRGRGAA